MLVVQTLDLVWSKYSRGTGGGRKRAGAPRALVIDAQAGEGACVVTRYRLKSWEDYEPVLEWRQASPGVPGREDALRIVGRPQGHFLLGFAGTPHGAPERHPIPARIPLAPGQFFRCIVNMRTMWSNRMTMYHETIYNVTCGDAIAPDRFLQGPPDRELDLRLNLF